MAHLISRILPKGSVLVFSLIVLSLMLVTALTLLSSAVLGERSALSTGNSTRSFQVADSGIEQILYQIYRKDHDTLSDLASAVGGASCVNGTIASSSGWQVAFYEGADGETRMTACSDTDWRTRVTKLKSEGTATGTVRAVEVAVAPPSSFEAGSIVMWSGSVSDVPDGWALCDGSNGTPDLRNRFVVGSGGSYGQGSTGGSADTMLSIANLPSHRHFVANSDSHVGGLSSSNYVCANSDRGNGGSYYFGGTGTVANVGLSSPSGGNQAFSNMPPYLALAYIMKL
ncbi:MAG: hypothetical protein HGA38_02565 [Candidatus Moranbacteria bacterium]|nr:hypothetical protein [Candidatus Moranbacteria bacterium]